MTALDTVVEALVGPVVSIRRLMGDRLDIAAQFVCNDDPWLVELRYQPCHEAPGSFGIPTRLHEKIKHIPVGIDRPPEPMLHPINRGHHLVQMPFGRGRSRWMPETRMGPPKYTELMTLPGHVRLWLLLFTSRPIRKHSRQTPLH